MVGWANVAHWMPVKQGKGESAVAVSRRRRVVGDTIKSTPPESRGHRCVCLHGQLATGSGTAFCGRRYGRIVAPGPWLVMTRSRRQESWDLGFGGCGLELGPSKRSFLAVHRVT